MWKKRYDYVAANSPKKAVWPEIQEWQHHVEPDAQSSYKLFLHDISM